MTNGRQPVESALESPNGRSRAVALAQDAEARQHRGHRGSTIVPHRALLRLELHDLQLRLALWGAVVFLLVWILGVNAITHLWRDAMAWLLEALSITGSVDLVRYEVIGGGHLDVPQVQAAAAELTRQRWWIGTITCAVILLLSYALPRRVLPLAYFLRLGVLVQGSAQAYFWFTPESFPYDVAGYTVALLTAAVGVIGLVPLLLGVTYFTLDFALGKKLIMPALVMAHLIVFVPLHYTVHVWLLHEGSLLLMPLLFWMFGLPLEIGAIVGLFAWAASWSPLPYRFSTRRTSRSDDTRLAAWLGAILLTGTLWAIAPIEGYAQTSSPAEPADATTQAPSDPLADPPRDASQEPSGSRVRTLEVGASYGEYTGDLGRADAQFARLTLSRPWRDIWRFDVGRAARFDDEGIGFGVSYSKNLRRDTSLSAGVSSGTGDVIFPDVRFDLGLEHGLLAGDALLANLGYTHIESKAENRSDGVSLGLRYYRGAWIGSAGGRVERGQPGSTTSRSGSVGLAYARYRRFYLGVGYEAGDVSYLLVGPRDALVDFTSRTWNAGFTVYARPNAGFAVQAIRSDADFYELWSVTLRVFREW